MHVLVLGGTGYLGAAAARALSAAGHQVTVAGRTGRSAEFAARSADLTRPESLAAVVTPDVDAVIHAATPGGDWATELAAVETLLAQRPGRFVYTSGVWVLGPTADADEATAPAPIAMVAGRPAVEQAVLDAGGVVLRPGIVHGSGAGIPALLVGWAREDGKGRYVGAADAVWPMVHVDDLAELYVLALTAPGGTVLHGVSEPGVPVAEIAAAADRAAGGTGIAIGRTVEEAAAELGTGFAEALSTSQRVRSPRAEALGWRPSRPGIIAELTSGSYRG
jgi:nucleoside-diphosphate-sugar epimerase